MAVGYMLLYFVPLGGIKRDCGNNSIGQKGERSVLKG